jgi:hypothetical protein
MPPRDPDETLVVLFRHLETQNDVKTLAEGRPVFDDIEVVEIRLPGNKDVKVFPATAMSTQWIRDPYSGSEHQITYAERFSHQYQQFKAKAAQTKSGTPLDYAPFLTAGRRAELRAQNIYTVEQLAAVEGTELKHLGPDGRGYKNQAVEYLAESKAGAPTLQMAAELEALRVRNAMLEEDAKYKAAQPKTTETDFDDMTADQLRDYITTHTGHEPVGTNLTHKQLKRLATEAKTSKAA